MLNAKEVLRYLRTLIVYDHKQLDDEQDDLEEESVTKKDDLYIKYGHESWQPSFWKWDARKNYSNITFSELKAVGLDGTYLTMSEFFKDVIWDWNIMKWTFLTMLMIASHLNKKKYGKRQKN